MSAPSLLPPAPFSEVYSTVIPETWRGRPSAMQYIRLPGPPAHGHARAHTRASQLPISEICPVPLLACLLPKFPNPVISSLSLSVARALLWVFKTSRGHDEFSLSFWLKIEGGIFYFKMGAIKSSWMLPEVICQREEMEAQERGDDTGRRKSLRQ